MKRISKFAAITGTMIAAVALVNFTPIAERAAQAGPVLDYLSGGYYGPGYGVYSGNGYSPYGYGYRTSPAYVNPAYDGYGPAYRRGYSYRSYRVSPYVGRTYAPYGYGGTTYYGNPYSPYGYGSYSGYGY